MLRLVTHGGQCCGISTIYGFKEAPDKKVSERARDPKAETLVAHGRVLVQSEMIDIPAKTSKEVLHFLIEHIQKNRTRGLIEAVLTSGRYNFTPGLYHPQPQIEVWGPVLEEAGFKPVTTFRNSNSNCDVTVYHYAYGQ